MSRIDKKKTGVILFGGTFNPIHKGHIRLCCSAWQAVQPRLIVLIPAQPFYKELSINDSQRMEMCRLAVQDIPFPVSVDDYELRRGGACRTYDTLCAMKKIFPHDQLYFLVGSDTFLSFTYWYRWRECARLARLLVGMRNSDNRKDVDQEVQVLQKQGITVQLLPHMSDNISSHTIRRNEQARRTMLPPSVYEYVQKHHLY